MCDLIALRGGTTRIYRLILVVVAIDPRSNSSVPAFLAADEPTAVVVATADCSAAVVVAADPEEL